MDELKEKVFITECQIDDMTPEELGLLLGELIDLKEVLDAYYTQVNMKKNRPGVLLTILTLPKNTEKVEEYVLTHSSTFGVRSYPVFRNILKRHFVTCLVEGESIHLKVGEKAGKILKVVPEYEDVQQAALKLQKSFRQIYVMAQAEGFKLQKSGSLSIRTDELYKIKSGSE